MTKDDAQKLAARLERIWRTTEPVAVAKYHEGNPDEATTWLLHTHLPGHLELEFYTSERGGMASVHLTRWINGKQDRGFLLVCEEESEWKIEDASDFWADELKVLPFFRRGCWLSGCPVEASAHEKAEWIQGFTSEEIEAWNLKM
ncbi:hypothetical protein EON80_19990 [bacterium]|nr:MAG: hypothetical protein EON80_19990 [bacterium]